LACRQHHALQDAGQVRERQHVIDPFDCWYRDRRPEARGFVRADLNSNVNDPDEFMASACFADKKTCDANSNVRCRAPGMKSYARKWLLIRSGSLGRWERHRPRRPAGAAAPTSPDGQAPHPNATPAGRCRASR
jgi:hypothetical protein